jgi:hypothetical protein
MSSVFNLFPSKEYRYNGEFLTFPANITEYVELIHDSVEIGQFVWDGAFVWEWNLRIRY